jgi:membrane-associated phospholipid phosphatase
MGSLHFHLEFVEAIARHRTPLLTDFFQMMSGIGSADFYTLLIMLVYVAWDKRLGVRLAYLLLVTVACNDLLKNIIRNPRPFVLDGSYRQRWAVTPAQAATLATEYSTPSGHAMSAGSFYSYLFLSVQKTWIRVVALLLILLIGFSRPYLGVHYGEDIVLGWAVGLGSALAGARFGTSVRDFWDRQAYGLQIAIAVGASVATCALSSALKGGHINGQLQGTVTIAGFVTGIVIACPLERRWVRFDARSGTTAAKVLRFALTMGLILFFMVAFRLAVAFAGLADSDLRFLVGYVGYAAAGVAAMFLGPWLFVRMGLSSAENRGAGQSALSADPAS